MTNLMEMAFDNLVDEDFLNLGEEQANLILDNVDSSNEDRAYAYIFKIISSLMESVENDEIADFKVYQKFYEQYTMRK